MPNKTAKSSTTAQKSPKIFRQRFTKKAKIQIAAFIAVVLGIIIYACIDVKYHGPFYNFGIFLSDKEAVSKAITSMGIFAPLVFILMQIAQTVISPIPGNIVGIVGGFVFGWWGVLWTTVGSTLGYIIVLALTRRFGRSFVERVISPELLKKFDYLAKEHGAMVFFLIFLIPGLPDDVLMYVAGLTEIPIKKLVWLAAVGRLPSVIGSNLIGSSVGDSDITGAIIITVLSLVVVIVAAVKRDAILKFINKYRRELSEKVDRIEEDIQEDLTKKHTK